MSHARDFFWRQDGFSWFTGPQKRLPDSKKTWKVFYYTLLDENGDKLKFYRREYIRINIDGETFII